MKTFFFTVCCAREIIVKWQPLANTDARHLENVLLSLTSFNILGGALQIKPKIIENKRGIRRPDFPLRGQPGPCGIISLSIN